ncbi:MAG: NUDIX hydrolase [Candidatus Micrarchaeota archaeon]|nr:NUDIX hydrolase [Candidatus Micrarchaeota archaeon]
MPKILYKGKVFRIERGIRRIKGRTIIFDKIVGPDTVGVLPVFDDGRLLLEKQYRYSVGKYLYEIPAGHIDKEETASEGAIRELEEETGYRAGTIKLMFKAHPSPGSKSEFASYFVATNLKKTKTKLENDEIISVKIVKLERALQMIKKNEIRDLKTVASILFYNAMIKQA